jgi:low temperature requirement protein LtrA
MAAGATVDRAHHRRRLVGRDPGEAHRAATPLELLFDLTFVVAFGIAADELAKYLADGRVWVGIGGFAFATFAVSWAWINYSWFASAYDTDDWMFRLATMVQMVGVIVLALGLEPAFASIADGDTLDNGVMVAGYVVMRVPMVFLWAQVARDDPERRAAASAYIWTISVSQVFWVVLAIVDLPIEATFAVALVLIAIEMSGPWIAERRRGGTPWHPHHIAERYGLLVIITLGEGILGTVASINAVVHGSSGWTVTAVVVATAGIGLIFATWWTYFAIPWADVLELHRAVVHLGVRPHRDLQLARGDRRRIACRRLLPRPRDDPQRDRHRPLHRHPGRDLHPCPLRPLHLLHPSPRSVPLLTPRGKRGRPGSGRGPGGRRGQRRDLPRRGDVHAHRVGPRLRDPGPPPRPGRALTHARRLNRESGRPCPDHGAQAEDLSGRAEPRPLPHIDAFPARWLGYERCIALRGAGRT